MADYTGVQNAENAYTGALSNRKNAVDLYNESVASLGIPEVRDRVKNLRTSITNTENLLNGVEGSVRGRTLGSLVTEAQKQRLIGLERKPIADQYNKQSGDYNLESANLSDLMGQASNITGLKVTDEDNKLKPHEVRLSGAKDKYKVDTDAEAEARRRMESDRTFNESIRQFNVNQATTKANASKTTSADIQSALLSDIDKYVKSGRHSLYEYDTEKRFIPQLIDAYGKYGYDQKAIADLVYKMRKPYEGKQKSIGSAVEWTPGRPYDR